MIRVCVTGASGFVGHHLVKYLKKRGYWVRGVDCRNSDCQFEGDEFLLSDLRHFKNCLIATKDIDWVFAMASDVGGAGFLFDSKNQEKITYNNTLIDWYTLEAVRKNKVKKYLYSSSACVYPAYKQNTIDAKPMKETDVYPADPDSAYGWEKLQAEHICRYYREYGIDIKIVRPQNIYGPECTWNNGREMAYAAICRKVMEAIGTKKDCIEIWGDGEQKRNYCYIADYLEGIHLIMIKDLKEPFIFNMGGVKSISINELAKTIIEISGEKLDIKHVPGPVGVFNRDSDNSLFQKYFCFIPKTSLRKGIEASYNWIKQERTRQEQI